MASSRRASKCFALSAAFFLFSQLAHAGEAEWKAHLDTGVTAYGSGDYRTAGARFEAALIEAQAFRGDDARLGLTQQWLGYVYQTQGRYADAEPMYRRSLAIYEKVLGRDHPDVADSLNNLAVLYRAQGRYADAEPLYRRSLAIREKILGRAPPR